MRILFVGRNLRIGGGTTFRYNIGRSLLARGHTVSVSALGGAMAGAYRKAGLRYHWVPPWTACAPLLDRVVRRERVELIHASNTTAGDLGLLAAERAGLPLVLSLHNTIADHEARHPCLKGARRIIVFDSGAEASARQFSDEFDVNRIVRVPRPVEPRAADPAQLSPLHVAYVGRLSKRKGRIAMNVIEGFGAYVRGQKSPEGARMLVLGDGSIRKQVEETAARISRDCGAEIRVLGQVLDPYPVLRTTGIVVGAGYAALEALMWGRAVIGAGFHGFGPITEGSLAEAVDGNFGDTVHRWEMTPENFTEAFRALQAQGSDPARRPEAWGLDRILAPAHSPDAVASRLESIYREVLDAG